MAVEVRLLGEESWLQLSTIDTIDRLFEVTSGYRPEIRLWLDLRPGVTDKRCKVDWQFVAEVREKRRG